MDGLINEVVDHQTDTVKTFELKNMMAFCLITMVEV